MTMQSIVESGMTFGPYPAAECFYIETSNCYRSIQHGVQMAEFLLLRQREGKAPVIWVVEAKSSSPRPETQPGFAKFIDEIREKLTNGFLLGMAARLQRHAAANEELSELFKEVDLQSLEYRFVLVINGHRKEWLVPLQEALSSALKPLMSVWALQPTSVMVLNHESALKLRLISQPAKGAPAQSHNNPPILEGDAERE